MWITLIAFWLLVLVSARRRERRLAYRGKPVAAWVLDVSGLGVQGTLIPWLQGALVVTGLAIGVPELRGAVELPGNANVSGFLLNVVAVDYLYYWNHRLLHVRRLWPLHAVHHTVTDLDVFGTSRNTLWTSFLIVYVWFNGAMLYLLAEPAGYAVGVAVTAALDLWRHSDVAPRGRLGRVLGSLLVLPQDHARHHGRDVEGGNFGANLSVWDRLHGTWVHGDAAPSRLGITLELPLWRQLLWPFP